MAVRWTQVSATGATGGAGVATANATTSMPINGYIRAVYLTYLDSPPGATTDVTIEGVQAPKVPVLTVTNAATDGWFYPMAQADNQAGADITGMGAPIAISDYVKVTIAQANDGDGVTMTLYWDDGR